MYHYDRNMVLAAYRAAFPAKLEPTEETLVRYDEELFGRYEEQLLAQAPDPAAPPDAFAKSTLVYYASRSLAVTPKAQVRHAYAYYGAVRPEPPA